jgi:ketosteroid isomerase-like protein
MGRKGTTVALEVEMTSQENKSVAMHAYGMFIKGNIPAVLETYSDDIVWVFPDVKGIPFAGTFRGKAGVADFFTRLQEAVETLSMKPQAFIADGDQVAVTGTTTRKSRATGVAYTTSWVHIITFKDGKSTRFEVHDNTAAIAEAFAPQPRRA